MNAATPGSPLAPGDAGRSAPERVRLSRNELLLIFGFWTVLAVLTAANRFLDPRGMGFRSNVSGASVVLSFVESYLWALLTPLIFWIAARFSLDRGSRAGRILLYVVVGLAMAMFVAVVMDQLRTLLLPFPPRRGPRPTVWMTIRFWFLNYAFIYMAVLAAGAARAYSLRYRSRQEEAVRLQAETAELHAKLADARLDALRMQLDPHFLFNTLHAISSLVERDPRGVRKMISRLSDLLRHTIEGAAEQEIPLRDELDLLRRYLDIMEVRFQGRLAVQQDVEERALDALVPNLILQPIVENAIKHGVSKVEGAGRVVLRAHVVGDTLLVAVENSGPGVIDESQAERGGIGLRNTRARLQQLYGAEQGFLLRSDGTAGVVAEIRLPFHTRADLREGAAVMAAR